MSHIVLDVFCGEFYKQFYLPDYMDGRTYINLYAYETRERDDITIPLDAANGIWFINTRKFKIQSNATPKNGIRIGNKIILRHGSVSILIYVKKIDLSSINFNKYYIGSMSQVTIGRSDDSAIIINHDFVSQEHALIYFEDGKSYIKDCQSKHGVYLNGRRITTNEEIHIGDVIYIADVKIVYLNTILAVNNPDSIVICRLYSVDRNNRSKEMDIEETDVQEEYFKRSPRILQKLEIGDKALDLPPQPKEYDPMPLGLRLAPSVAMLMGMGIAAYLMDAANPLRFVMITVMTITSVILPIVMAKYQKDKHIKTEQKRRDKYLDYLKNIIETYTEKQKFNREIMYARSPENELCVQKILNHDRSLWERIPENSDFLEVRVGTGSVPFSVELTVDIEGFSLIDDPLKEHAQRTAEKFKYIDNVPVSLSLTKEPIIGMIGTREKTIDLAKSIVLQLCALHCYTDLKFVFFHEEEDDVKWDFARWLPHTWTNDKKMRFIGCNHSEVNEILLYLDPIIAMRQEDKTDKKVFLPHYMVFIMSPRLVENEVLIRNFVENRSDDGQRVGMTLIYIQDTINMLPKSCNTIVQYVGEECSIYKNDDSSNKMNMIKPDTVEGLDLNEVSKSLFKTKVYENNDTHVLPDMLTFMGMYKVSKIEQLKIATRWSTNLSYNSIESPIGIDTSGSLFSLNIHEKYHGPHGLIAGMTGSGKSEFIQSFILSIAINYHPHDVSFVLIDYKGGGMANCFNGLPHLSGTITNLGGNQIKRSLVSLKSELKRRQSIFSKTNVNHIDKYQKLYRGNKVSEPLPHLVIIADEFAELKSQQQEFMQELVSTARIGRSLGVHLILATQKPSGVVDNQIWSNTTFRICLKVLDKSDSNEMIKRPEAANITNPGRAYVQVGNNEIFQFIQSGWSGAPYIPKEELADEDQRFVTLIDKCGRVVLQTGMDDDAENISEYTQLEAIVDTLSRLANKNGIKPFELWRPPLKETVILSEIIEEDKSFDGKWKEQSDWLSAPIGIADDTQNQSQPVLSLDIGEYGHVALYGLASSGKTTFIQTMIYSMALKYSPQYINMYVLDFAGRTMAYFKHLPHVGDVVFAEDDMKIKKLFKMIKKELVERKTSFASLGVNNLKTYIEVKETPMPSIMLVINNYTSFLEHYPAYEEEINFLSREGSSYGINLFIATGALNSIKSKVAQNIKLSYALQLSDKYEYTSIVGITGGLEPEKTPGRGLVKLETAVEFQTALALDAPNDSIRVSKLKEIFEDMDQAFDGRKAPNIPTLPEELIYSSTIKSQEYQEMLQSESIPLGYDLEEVEVIGIPKDFSTYSVLGHQGSGKTNFLMNMIAIAANELKWKLYVVDDVTSSLRNHAIEKGCKNYANNKQSMDILIENFKDEMLQRRNDSKDGKSREEIIEIYGEKLFVMDNCSYFLKEASENSVDLLLNILKFCQDLGVHFVFAENPQLIFPYSRSDIFPYMFKSNEGLLFGGKFDEQRIFDNNVELKKRSLLLDTGTSFKFSKGHYTTIKVPHYRTQQKRK